MPRLSTLSNPRFADFAAVLEAHPEWFKPWSGTFFRFQTTEFPGAKDILSGEGAKLRGGRWNRPGIAAIYGSTADITALEECKANDRYYGIQTRSPRLLVAIEARLERVLDLTVPEVRRALRYTLKASAAEDWRKVQQAGGESDSQALGRAIASAGADGLLARSSAVWAGMNVVVFPTERTQSRLSVVEGEKLARLIQQPPP